MKKYILLFFLFFLAVNLSFASERHGDIVRKAVTKIVGFTSDCDYVCDGTDDHIQINAASNSLILTGGGTVLLREGIYRINDDLSTAIASTTIMGQGSGTELKFLTDYKKFKLTHENCRLTNLRFNLQAESCIAAEISKSNCSVDNIWVDFVGDGNYAIDTSASIYNVVVKDVKMVSETANFVGVDLGSINPILSGCVLENNTTPTSQSRAFQILGCSQGIISNCKARGGFFRIRDSTGVVLEGNLIDFPGDYGISLSGINRDCVISNNYISSCVISGITYTSGESSDFIINANRLENCTTGIALHPNFIRFQIQGNNFQSCGSETIGSATDLRMRLNIDKNGDWLTDDLVTTLETVSELFLTDENAISSQYKLLITTVPTGAQSTLTASITTTDVIVASFTTNSPLGITTFPEGIWDLHFHGYKSASTKVLRVYFTITKSTGSGETVLFSSEESNPLTASSESYIIHVATNEIVITTGDYITLRVYASVTGVGVDPTLTLEMEGTTATRLQFPALLPEVSVTKIIAGTNITITPTSGKGEVTINSTAVGYTTYYALLGGAMQDIYKSTTVPIDVIPVPSSWTLTGFRAYTTYCSTNSAIFEIRNTTGCYVPLWTSIATVELSSGSAQSNWVNLSTNLDEDERVGLFVTFVPGVGVDLQVGAGVILRYWRKE